MMATKEQERKALAQIRKILEGLGDDSYLGTAFTGCLDDAETNIENDWGLSMYDRWQSAEQKVEKLERALTETADKLIEEHKRAEEAERIANDKIESADRWCARYHEAEDHATDLAEDIRVRDEIIRERDDEIVRLKARLYDLMTAGA